MLKRAREKSKILSLGISLLNDCIQTMINYYDVYDSLRTVIPFSKTPYKMYFIKENMLVPFIKEHPYLKEPYNQARQHFPNTYLHNGCIDIIKTDILFNQHQMSGNRILPYIMNETEKDDIDTLSDFQQSEQNTKKDNYFRIL
jgi:CMP-N-acetylneuraminic acid synthetase